MARHRRRLGHARRARLVRPLRRRAARRDRRRGHRHPRRAVGAAPAHRPRSLRRRAEAAGRGRQDALARRDAAVHPDRSTSCASRAARRARSTSPLPAPRRDPPRGARAHPRRRAAGCARPTTRCAPRSPRSTTASSPSVLDARELEALERGYRERVTDVHLPHIRELPRVLPDLFADAAARAFAAGFDGVELHYAHAYTMASFLSAQNTRDDGYGGPRESRRAPAARGHRRGARARRRPSLRRRPLPRRRRHRRRHRASTTPSTSASSSPAPGSTSCRSPRAASSRTPSSPRSAKPPIRTPAQSGYECMPSYISDERGPFGRNVPLAAAVRAAVRAAGFATPTVVAGGIYGFDQAEAILARGEADIVAAARQSLADPDWFLKMRLGRGDEVRRCEFTNYCEALDQRHKQVTCKLWDRVALDEPDVRARPHRPPPPDGAEMVKPIDGMVKPMFTPPTFPERFNMAHYFLDARIEEGRGDHLAVIDDGGRYTYRQVQAHGQPGGQRADGGGRRRRGSRAHRSLRQRRVRGDVLRRPQDRRRRDHGESRAARRRLRALPRLHARPRARRRRHADRAHRAAAEERQAPPRRHQRRPRRQLGRDRRSRLARRW